MCGMTFARDPLSMPFDGAARRFLVRAYERPGEWTVTHLSPPDAAWRVWAAGVGVDLDEPDPGGGTRWDRAFKRSAYWNLRWYGYAGELRRERRIRPRGGKSMLWQVGGLVERPGWPGARREIRACLIPGGGAWEYMCRTGKADGDPYGPHWGYVEGEPVSTAQPVLPWNG